MIIPCAPSDLESYLAIIVDEIRDLSLYGMTVRRDGNIVCQSKVHLAICSGDLVGMGVEIT